MLGRLLCRIGVHRWEYKDLARNAVERKPELVTYAKCKRRECMHGRHWIPVNVDSIRSPW